MLLFVFNGKVISRGGYREEKHNVSKTYRDTYHDILLNVLCIYLISINLLLCPLMLLIEFHANGISWLLQLYLDSY